MRRVLALAALALALGTSPALGQDNRETLPAGQVRFLVAKYGQCLVRYQHDKVKEAIERSLRGEAGDWPVSDECVASVPYSSATLTIPDDAYRYALADALYAADFGRAPPPEGFDAVPLTPPPAVPALDAAALAQPGRMAAAMQARHDRLVANRYLMIVGDCVVRTAPAAAHALLGSAVETGGETEAIVALQSTLAQCLPKNQTVRFNRASLRGIVALNGWRLRTALARS